MNQTIAAIKALLYAPLTRTEYEWALHEYPTIKKEMEEEMILILLQSYKDRHTAEKLEANIRNEYETREGSCLCFYLEEEGIEAVVLKRISKVEEEERHWQTVLIPRWNYAQQLHFFTSWIVCSSGLKLRESFRLAKEDLRWNLTLGEGVLFVHEKLKDIRTESLIYRFDLEEGSKRAVSKREFTELKDLFRQFQSSLSIALYQPSDIMYAYLCYFWKVGTVLMETGRTALNREEFYRARSKLESAITSDDLKEIFEIYCCIFHEQKDEKEYSVLTRKTIRMIREYYNQDIRLEEIAEKLAVSSVYLGRMFQRETGLTFRVFLTEMRMERAKSMLIGTSERVKQIAAMIGYQDAKYFSKVFYKETGYLPLEYRKMYK